MRYSRCLITVLLAGVVLAGCSNSKRDSSERLGSQIDEARRLFDQATTILASPQQVDQSTGDTPTVEPVDYPQIEKNLAQAGEILKKALSDNPDATLGTKSDAIHLLGKIHLASGKYYSAAADALRYKADNLRFRSHNAIGLARSNSIQAEFGAKLANMPKEKITTLQGEITKQLTGLENAISKIDEEIRSRQQANTRMSDDNAKLKKQARSLRDKGEIAGTTKGLALFKQAQVIEGKINDKDSEIAANQQEIEVLELNKIRLQQKQQDTDIKLATIKKHLQDMADFGHSTMKNVEVARQQASEQRQKAEKLARQVVECCADITEREELAIDALGNAVKRLNEARKSIRNQINAANAAMKESNKPNEILKIQSDERSLATIITDRSSASLILADLHRRQITTGQANTDFADAIGNQLGDEATTIANELKGYLPDADKTKTLAEENYLQAEKELEGILKLRLKGDARNDLWMSRTLLANAYFGHYKLTGQNDVLKQAKELVDNVLADKKDSPHMEQVVRLQRLIDESAKYE